MSGGPARRFNRYPLRAPRFWAGMTLPVWWRVLARNRFRVHVLRWPMAALTTGFTLLSSVVGRLQQWRYERRLRETAIAEPPIFVLGHWRSGTTYLHELLALDERFGAPTTYATLAPHIFLLTESVAIRFFSWATPRRRVMDDVTVGWERPQEDEWALCNLGVPSPYLRVAFPNEPPPFMEYLSMEGVPAEARERWKRALLGFLQAVTVRQGRRLVLKSPAHTGRVGTLLELFPDAKFVHIVRDPFEVYPSTLRMWEAFDRTQGLQRFRGDGLAAFVLEAHRRLYDGFERDRPRLRAEQLCEVRYEDLIRDPVGTVAAIYARLELGGFDAVLARIRAHVAQQRDYRPNRHELAPEAEALVARHWAAFIERYGYARPGAGRDAPRRPASRAG